MLVDHTFAYTGAVEQVRQLVQEGTLGDLYYFDSVRINLGLFQPDVNVLWDLAVHDLSIMLRWISGEPRAVCCIGVAHVTGHLENMAYLTVFFPANVVAHVHVNWLSPVKVRRTLLAGTKRMVVYDDLEPSEKVKVYDRGLVDPEQVVGSGGVPIAYRRTGDVWSPQVDMREALSVEAMHFVDCIRGRALPRTGGREALRLIRILEAAQRSMREGGRQVLLEGGP
jgi:predicted dehydrogenase